MPIGYDRSISTIVENILTITNSHHRVSGLSLSVPSLTTPPKNTLRPQSLTTQSHRLTPARKNESICSFHRPLTSDVNSWCTIRDEAGDGADGGSGGG